MANYPSSLIGKTAWEMAQMLHQNQVRKTSQKSYFDEHVQKVNEIVKQFTTKWKLINVTNEDLYVAALLHDTVEDCFENKWDGYKIIKEQFGKNVADLVLELTSDKSEIEFKYEGNKAEYLKDKMLRMSNEALLLKLSDRLQNLNDLFISEPKFATNYSIETQYILDNLRTYRRLHPIHKHLILNIQQKLDNFVKIKSVSSN